MNLREIRQLVKLMIDSELSELDMADGDKRIHLKRGGEAPVVAAPQAAPAAQPAAPETADGAAPPDLIEIRSPMVGTFYTAASPDSDPYVHVGDTIAEDAVVCIVEAMKVMNEIKADCSGVVAEICVQNAQPVEYGQVLLRVRPA